VQKQTDTLDALVRPRAIAVVGASADTEKLNGRIVRFLQDKGYPGKIYPINPKADEILGIKCYKTLESVPGEIDLAVIGLAAAQVPNAIREAGRKGVRAVLVFASGFAEMGEEGRRLQQELTDTAAEAGVRLCGPNSVGIVNAFDRIVATFSQVGNNPVNPGPLALVTQSGAIGTVVNTLANRRGLGLGYLVHTGNEADITVVDAMGAVTADDRVKVVCAYLEGVRDGVALCRLAGELMEKSTPIVAVKVGRSAAGARAVASHTGSLAAEDRVFDDLARQFGIVRARNESHMLDLAEGFAYCPLPGPGGVGLITQSGGTAVMMADRAEELGLAVPTLTESTQQALRGVLPPYASFGNPVDASMQAVADPSLLGKGLSTMLGDPQVAVGIVWLQHMDAKADLLVEMFSGLKRQLAKPWIVAWAAAPQKAVDELRKRGICVVGSAETAVDIAHGLVSYAEARRRHASAQAKVLPATKAHHRGPVSSMDAAKLLAQYGVPLAKAQVATSASQAAQIAATFGAPVALKIESPDLPHKTDIGGVRLGLRGEEPVRAAYDEIVANAKKAAPEARIDGVLVQEMSAAGVELVVGLRKDPSFGMLVMLGIGGVFVEAYRDVTFRKAPLNRETAQSMVRDLRGQRLLGEFRGRPAVDQERIVQLLCAVSDLGAANASWLEELDLNPVIARHDGAVAVDWLMIGT
jgi:acyl-CoA synthetase (NDP forming)